MSDDLDELRKQISRATPTPDPGVKDAHLRLALENFDRVQGSQDQMRPTVSRPFWARMTEGALEMLNVMTTRGGLAATTALVAVGLLLILPNTDEILRPSSTGVTLSVDQPGRVGPTAPPAETMTVDEEVAFAKPDISLGDNRAQPGFREREDQNAPAQAQRRERTEADLAVQGQLAKTDGAATTTENFQADALTSTLEASEPGIMADQSAAMPNALVRTAPAPEVIAPEGPNTEAYANAETNPVKVVTADPVSTFSIDVDTASYGVVRSSLMAGRTPPPEAVRIEEMVNYFPYSYPAPEGPHPFQPTVTILPSPWNEGTNLVHIGIQGTPPATETAPPLNLVFLIDTSGSMQDANKLPLLKQSFRLMLSQLRPQDEVAIVTYAGSAGQVLAPTPAGETGTILSSLDRLQAGGSTAGQAGLQQAYATAETMAQNGDRSEVTRVILATDGDFNVGISDPAALKDFIAEKRETGTYLSVLGFGRGNLDDATMQALAQNGNGQASYIDTLSEAQKVLVDQLSGALFPIANDVKIQIEFNPAQIAEYRLLGYETRALRREDFNNDKIDAGDIGAGHTVTAIYEVTPVGSPAVLSNPLRYAADEETSAPDTSGEIGYLKLRYKTPGASVSQLIEAPILPGAGTITDDARFSAAIAGFGQLLRGGEYMGDWSYDDAIALANSARGSDDFGYRSEAVQLMRLAGTLDR